MAAPENKKKKCLTKIPKEWPQFLAPRYIDGMSVEEANRLWAGFLRVHNLVGINPKVYKKFGE